MSLINLGLVKAIFVNSVAPTNLNVIWKDTSTNLLKYYDSTVPGWVPLGNTSGVTISTTHLSGLGASPGIAGGTGAGTGPTVSISGSDLAGFITVVAGTTPTASATIATITFSVPYTSAPRCIMIRPANSLTSALGGGEYADQASITTNLFIFAIQGVTLSAGQTYKWFYNVIQ